MTAPNVENLRKQAKGLLKKLRTGDAQSVARARAGLPRLSGVADDEVADAHVTLQEVQHVIAVGHGYANWDQLLSDSGVVRPRKRMRSTLNMRPGLPNMRREAEWFLWMVSRGKGWPMDRIRKGLPRVASLSNEEIVRAGVTLEEAQQVVAADYGYPDWATLENELGQLHPIRTFEDLAELEDQEIQHVIFRLGRDRLAVVLKSASDRLKERFQQCMSADAWTALAEALEELGPMPLSTVEAEQAQVLAKFRTDDPLV